MIDAAGGTPAIHVTGLTTPDSAHETFWTEPLAPQG